ncbi:MAG: hypothetical protein Q9211_003882 [Gyalolechia sp. 1 TL-2023]
MGAAEDIIAETVLATYDSLSPKYKPAKPTGEFFQWVPLSGIVAIKDDGSKPICLALGSGMKCLPVDQVAEAKGSVLHDWHAEVVALRAFNHLMLHECLELATSPSKLSSLVRQREADEISERDGPQLFAIRHGLQLHMYSSEAPCGDASMELLMEAQADPTPWPIDSLHPATKKLSGQLRGRESFAELGIVRRKPGADLAGRIMKCLEADLFIARADSPQTLSKSCSDKLALKQCTSLLSSCTSMLVHPANAYLTSLVLPQSQHVEQACDRSFGPNGRMKPITNQEWPGGYAFRPFNVRTTKQEFIYSRRNKPVTSQELRTSNLAAVYNARLQEALVVGRLQGRRKVDPKAASAICSTRMWKTALQVLAALGMPKLLQQMTGSSDIRGWKESAIFTDRQRVKSMVRSRALCNWIRNDGDCFEIVFPLATEPRLSASPPVKNAMA